LADIRDISIRVVRTVKFYSKSIVASAVLPVLVLLALNLIKGVDVPLQYRKFIAVPIIVDIFFIVFNEKLSTRERWEWQHYLLLGFVGVMASALVYSFL